MMTAIRFEGLSLPVSDVTRSVAFYCDQLGFTVEVSTPGFALLRQGDGTIGLMRSDLSSISAEARNKIHLELSTDDLDGFYAELLAIGVELAKPPHDTPWERSLALRDPDGYRVEIQQGRRGQPLPT